MNTITVPATVASFALALSAFALPTDQKEWKEAEEAVKIAKRVFSQIQASKPDSTQKIPFNLKDDPMEGTITKRTYAKGKQAITLDYLAGDHGGSTEHYYFENGELVFAFVKDTHWNFSTNATATSAKTEDTLTERRFYFRKGKCLRALERSVTTSNAKKLAGLIQEKANKEVSPEQSRVERLQKTAKGMLIVNRGAMAQDFFQDLYSAPVKK